MALAATFSPSRNISALHRQKLFPLPGRRNISTLPVHTQTLLFKSYLQIGRAVLHKEGVFVPLALTFPPSRDVSALHRQKHPPSSRTNSLF